MPSRCSCSGPAATSRRAEMPPSSARIRRYSVPAATRETCCSRMMRTSVSMPSGRRQKAGVPWRAITGRNSGAARASARTSRGKSAVSMRPVMRRSPIGPTMARHACTQYQGPAEGLPQRRRGAQGHRLRGGGGRLLRAPRPERRRQNHRHRHHHLAGEQDQRRGPNLRPQYRRRTRTGKGLSGPRAPGDQPEPVREGTEHGGEPGRLLRPVPQARLRACRALPHRAETLGPARRHRPQSLRRHEAPADDRPRAGARAEAADPGRAHRRRRYRDPPLDVELPAEDQRRGHDHHPHHPLPGRGREPVPARGHHRRGPHHRGCQHGRRAAQAEPGGIRVDARRAASGRAPARALRTHAASGRRPGGDAREAPEPERRIRRPVGGGRARGQHAQQGQPAGGALHGAGGEQGGSRRDETSGAGRGGGGLKMDLRANWVGLQTIVYKEFTRVIRIWVQTIVPPAITMSLYFIIFGTLIGKRIGAMDGYNYMQYIAPGLIMMSVITNSYGNVVSSFFGAKFGRHIEEMLVSPMSNATIILGHVAGGVVRGLMVGALVSVIALAFTRLTVQHPFVTFSMVILTSVVFSLAGFINAVFAKKFDDISIIPTFVLTPLTYLGGVFYSISLLPEFWQKVSLANPILYMVNAFRYGVLGASDIPIGVAYLIVCGFVVLLFTVSLVLMNRGVGIRE